MYTLQRKGETRAYAGRMCQKTKVSAKQNNNKNNNNNNNNNNNEILKKKEKNRHLQRNLSCHLHRSWFIVSYQPLHQPADNFCFVLFVCLFLLLLFLVFAVILFTKNRNRSFWKRLKYSSSGKGQVSYSKELASNCSSRS